MLGRIGPVADMVCPLKAPLILSHCLEKKSPVRYHKKQYTLGGQGVPVRLENGEGIV